MTEKYRLLWHSNGYMYTKCVEDKSKPFSSQAITREDLIHLKEIISKQSLKPSKNIPIIEEWIKQTGMQKANRREELLQIRKQAAIQYQIYYKKECPAFTCDECLQVYKCKYAYDFYNTGGDCLAEK